MKVLEEIVAYLHRRGALDDDEVRAFEVAGFIRPAVEDGEDHDRRAWADEERDDEQETLFPPAIAAPRPAAARPRGTVLKAARLASRVNAWLRENDRPLGALGRIAEPPDAGTRWERIARVARAESASIAAELAASIDAGASSFDGLWSAIGLDGHLTLLARGEHGPAVAAYRALVRARDYRDLGKHIWLLRYRALARLHDLVIAQRRAAEAFLVIATERPKLFGKWLSRDYHPLGYWTLVLLHNARRRAAGLPWETLSEERPVRRMLPEARVFSGAWSLALDLGDAAARDFLHAFWEAEMVSRLLWGKLNFPGRPERYSDVWADAVIAAEEKPAHAEFFARIRQGMRGAAALDSAVARAVMDAIWGHQLTAPADVGSMAELALPSHPYVALFCPAGWD